MPPSCQCLTSRARRIRPRNGPESREFCHFWPVFGARVAKPRATHRSPKRENPSTCWGSRSGASRTRTGDLLGAIQACASAEFGLFAGFSPRWRPGPRLAFSASFRPFRLGSGQRNGFLARSPVGPATPAELAALPTVHARNERHPSRQGDHLLLCGSFDEGASGMRVPRASGRASGRAPDPPEAPASATDESRTGVKRAGPRGRGEPAAWIESGVIKGRGMNRSSGGLQPPRPALAACGSCARAACARMLK
jgi:hypothetical protein